MPGAATRRTRRSWAAPTCWTVTVGSSCTTSTARQKPPPPTESTVRVLESSAQLLQLQTVESLAPVALCSDGRDVRGLEEPTAGRSVRRRHAGLDDQLRQCALGNAHEIGGLCQRHRTLPTIAATRHLAFEVTPREPM